MRKQYQRFLGDLYVSSDVYARSTDYDRTRMSLLLVLAGLYPPKGSQRWKSDLNWQPVPMRDAPIDNDPIMYSIACPTYVLSIFINHKLFLTFTYKMYSQKNKNSIFQF